MTNDIFGTRSLLYHVENSGLRMHLACKSLCSNVPQVRRHYRQRSRHLHTVRVHRFVCRHLYGHLYRPASSAKIKANSYSSLYTGAHARTYTRTSMRARMHVRVCAHACMPACMHACMHAPTCSHPHRYFHYKLGVWRKFPVIFQFSFVS